MCSQRQLTTVCGGVGLLEVLAVEDADGEPLEVVVVTQRDVQLAPLLRHALWVETRTRSETRNTAEKQPVLLELNEAAASS